jgi:hypothetical protein
MRALAEFAAKKFDQAIKKVTEDVNLYQLATSGDDRS